MIVPFAVITIAAIAAITSAMHTTTSIVLSNIFLPVFFLLYRYISVHGAYSSVATNMYVTPDAYSSHTP